MIYKLVCKETPKTKFRIPNMHGVGLTRADINITQATTVLFGGLFYLKEHEKKRKKWKWCFNMVTAFSRLMTLEAHLSFCFKFSPAGPAICFCLILIFYDNFVEQIRQLSLFAVKDTKQNNL